VTISGITSHKPSLKTGEIPPFPVNLNRIINDKKINKRADTCNGIGKIELGKENIEPLNRTFLRNCRFSTSGAAVS
jgi:hypothetical protein